MSDNGNPQSTSDLGTGAQPIIAQISAYETQYQPWIERGNAIIKRYRDVRLGSTNAPLNPLVQRKFNILWSNVETLKPTLWARLPKVIVEREYKDKDPVARIACEIAERAGNYTIRKEKLGDVMKSCVADRLLPGRAVAWVDYQVEGGQQPVTDPTGASVMDAKGQPQTQFVKTSERAVPRYCDWLDFGHSPVRVWDEVKYAWYIVYLDEDALKKRFPQFYGPNVQPIPLDRKPEDDKNRVDTVIPQSTIYVVYCKAEKVIRWVHKSVEVILDEQPPSVNFEDFWPWPKPLFATMTNESLQPIPDFYYYQDQADELDKITNRLARVIDGIKVVGVYDQNVDALQRLFHPNGAPDNLLTPVQNWAAFAEKGGITAAFQLAPLGELIETANGLVQQREQILQVIYQITGIADIVRGASDPNETATAQGIKSQFASLRIKDTQNEVARFSRDIAAMIVECIVENFEPDTIKQMTLAETFCKGPDGQFDPQLFQQALGMLRDQKLRDFHIDIETDSTINLDDQAEKMAANEFMQAMATFIQAWGPVVENKPALLPMVSEMLLFLARRYRAGRSLEGAIENAMQALQQQAQQGPKPDPEMTKVQGQLQLAQQKAQMDLQAKQQQGALDAQLEQQKAQREDHRETVQAQADMAVEQQKAQLDMQIAREKAALDMQLAQQKAAIDAEVKRKQASQQQRTLQ